MKKLLLLILLLLCSGCYDYTEPNNTVIVNGIGIDYKDNKYYITYEIIDTKLAKDSEEKHKSYTVNESGTTLVDAMNNIKSRITKEISLSHLDIIIVSKSLLEQGLYTISDYIIRDVDITSNVYLVASSNPKEVLECNDAEYPINSVAIKKVLKLNNYKSKDQFDYQLSNIISKKKDITIPVIDIKEDISLIELAILKEDKINYYTKDYDLYFLLTERANNCVFTNPLGAISINNSNIKIKNKNDLVEIEVNLMGKLNDLNKDYDLKDKNNIDYIENIFRETINNELTSFINTLKQNNSNILGYDNIKPTKINVNLHINREGLTFKVIK